MPVIAMTREMGSCGKDVAIALARELGISIVHHEMVEHDLAGMLHLRESTVHRYLEGGANALERWRINKKDLALHTAQEIFHLAEEGDVLIRGWGATLLLRPVSHVVCIRVCAPMEFRINTLMERLQLDDERFARREIRKNDEAHERVIRRLFQADWKDPLLYDLVLNTERLSVDEGVALTRQLVEGPSFQETIESRSRLASIKRAASIRSLPYGRGRAGEIDSSLIPDQERHLRLQRLHRDEPPCKREDRDFGL